MWKSGCFGFLFSEFLLSVEFMEPGQLSISLYSVCKISDLNTEPISLGVGLFFLFFLVLLLLFCQSESCLSIRRGFCFGTTEDGFYQRCKHKHLTRVRLNPAGWKQTPC